MHLLRSVLSDLARRAAKQDAQSRLNAPFGARCFLTGNNWIVTPTATRTQILMHLLALGAF